jgi:prephenate dehydrogenase
MIQSGQDSSPPVFERIGIVGLGLVGGSIALAARQVWPSGLVIGVDRNEVLEQAVARHAIDVAASDLTIVSEADIVILAAPVLRNISLLKQLPEYIQEPVIVTDVGSTKRAIVQAATALPPHVTFVGGHPLGGSTRGGIEAARADLFTGRPWLFTPSPGAGDARLGAGESQLATENAVDDARTGRAGEAMRRLFRFAKALGAVPYAIDAGRHDHLVAFISHLPQLTVSVLMHIIGDAVGEEGLGLSGRGLQDTTRLAGSPADIWADICASNADEIRAAIDALVDVLQRLRGSIDDRETIERLFEAANRWRSALVDKRS